MRNNKILFIAESGIIAALYVALTLLLAPISFGHIQFRISEILIMLVLLQPKYVFALTIGCFVANIYNGPLDMLFGTSATLISLVLMIIIKKPFIAALMPVLINGIIISIEIMILSSTYEITAFLSYFATISLGEAAVLYALGIPFVYFIGKNKALCEILKLKSLEQNEFLW